MVTVAVAIKQAAFGYTSRRRTQTILSDLSLDLFAGEMIGLVGLNGTGKSTLLKSICGLLPVLHGEIFFDGTSINEIGLTELSKRIAVVLTEKIGGFNLTAYDVVAAGQMPYTNA